MSGILCALDRLSLELLGKVHPVSTSLGVDSDSSLFARIFAEKNHVLRALGGFEAGSVHGPRNGFPSLSFTMNVTHLGMHQACAMRMGAWPPWARSGRFSGCEGGRRTSAFPYMPHVLFVVRCVQSIKEKFTALKLCPCSALTTQCIRAQVTAQLLCFVVSSFPMRLAGKHSIRWFSRHPV